MGESRSLTLIFLVITVVLSLLLNISYVEARRGSSRGSRGYTRRTSYGGSNGALTRGNDPLPWWAITIIFVGGVLGLFICVMGLRKIYEKKRQRKIQSMLRIRSLNWAERRRSAEQNRSNTTSGVPEGSLVAPPSYEQSAMDDAQPPAYSKDVNTEDEHTMPPPPPAPVDTSVPMDTTPPTAPPSYDVAQNDGSEVVEVGGAATMD